MFFVFVGMAVCFSRGYFFTGNLNLSSKQHGAGHIGTRGLSGTAIASELKSEFRSTESEAQRNPVASQELPLPPPFRHCSCHFRQPQPTVLPSPPPCSALFLPTLPARESTSRWGSGRTPHHSFLARPRLARPARDRRAVAALLLNCAATPPDLCKCGGRMPCNHSLARP